MSASAWTLSREASVSILTCSPGGELYSPESDSVLIETIIDNVNDNIEVIVIPHNLDTREFGVKAAHYIIDEMKLRGKLPEDFSYTD